MTHLTTLQDKVRFLSAPDSYGPEVRSVQPRETHMSWVFLTPDRVYKLKKPLKRPLLDFSTIRRRRFFCQEELRLNRRLAADTYLRVLPLRRGGDGCYAFGDHGRIVDWLVEMRRLRDHDMLDRRIEAGSVDPSEIASLADLLAAFYNSQPACRVEGQLFLKHLSNEQAINRAILLQPEFDLGPSTKDIAAATDRALARAMPEIEARVGFGRIVEGHGDLRPEHVWLGDPLQIIDCLEFNRSMRMLDPYDEVNYLGMECEILGAAWIREHLMAGVTRHCGHPPSDNLLAAYGAFRALLRARISIVHLLEKPIRKPEKWRPLTLRYLNQARRELVKSQGRAGRRSNRLREAG